MPQMSHFWIWSINDPVVPNTTTVEYVYNKNCSIHIISPCLPLLAQSITAAAQRIILLLLVQEPAAAKDDATSTDR